MNRKLLVNLLRKSIEELDMITEGFMEMDEYPTVIVQLAKRKTEDIQSIIDQLAEMRVHTTEAVVKDQSDVQTIHPVSENIDFMPMTQEITDIKTVKLEELEKENEMETVTLVTSEAK